MQNKNTKLSRNAPPKADGSVDSELLFYTQAVASATDDLLSFVDTNYIYKSVNLAYCKNLANQ